MPQTAYKENNKLVYVLPRLATAVAAQRNVQVITEPACQADVPAPPQFGKGAGAQRLAEVFRQFKPKHGPRAKRHVTSGGKITVKLISIQQAGQQQDGAGVCAVTRVAVHRIHRCSSVLAMTNFFEKAPQNAEQPA